jgi:hypothetical protein
MLIKEEKMRRILYAAILLAVLLIPAANVSAEPDQVCDYEGANWDGWWLLGEIWWTPDWLGDPEWWDVDCWNWAPGERVDTWMTRPAAWWPGGWPLDQPPIMGGWWMDAPESDQRRMSYEFSGDDYKFANMWGGYYAQFMLPRDEVWFPCSYPYKWQCNYHPAPYTYEFHSPAVMAYECYYAFPNWICLDWPWFYDDGFNLWQEAPYDTISPAVIDIFNTESPWPYGYHFELEIAGYFWKWSDLEDGWEPIIVGPE